MSLFGSAAGAIAGGVSSIIGGALSNSAARHAATVANQRNIYNYQHRYQWAMDDMQKAGLNPMLAATQGIGGSINGASALSANYNIGEGVTAGMSAQLLVILRRLLRNRLILLLVLQMGQFKNCFLMSN